MCYIFAWQLISRCDNHLSWLTVRDVTAVGQHVGSTCILYGSVHTSSRFHAFIGGVHNHVSVTLTYISCHDVDVLPNVTGACNSRWGDLQLTYLHEAAYGQA